jgi:hypothetical protein
VSIGRIYFPGNPWPEGHAIQEFVWKAEVSEGEVRFRFQLDTANYYAEREFEDDENVDYPSDWAAPIVWGNYHRAHFRTNKPFGVCPAAEYSLERLDDLRLHVDPLPCDVGDYEGQVFHVYLLGHDTVVDHHIEFHRVPGTDSFDISWRGKIALTYVGNYEPEHEFHATIRSISAPRLEH